MGSQVRHRLVMTCGSQVVERVDHLVDAVGPVGWVPVVRVAPSVESTGGERAVDSLTPLGHVGAQAPFGPGFEQQLLAQAPVTGRLAQHDVGEPFGIEPAHEAFEQFAVIVGAVSAAQVPVALRRVDVVGLDVGVQQRQRDCGAVLAERAVLRCGA